MILDTTTRLEVQIDTGSADYTFDYIAYNANNEPSLPSTVRGVISASADVTVLPIPVSPIVRFDPLAGFIYNRGTASIVCKIKTDDGTTERMQYQKTLEAGGTLQYNKNIGWFREAVV